MSGHKLRDAIIIVLHALRNTSNQKCGQDRSMLPVQQTDDLQLGAGCPGHDDVGLLEVGMANTEMTKGLFLGYERRRDAEIPLQVVYVVRRWLFLILIIFSPKTLEGQQRLTKLLKVRQLFICWCYQRGFNAFI